MNREDLFKHHEELCKRALEIMKKKNHDYAGNSGKQPFANFQRCEAFDVCSTEAGFLVRIIDKISRLSTFAESGKLEVENVSYTDAVLDIINYMILFSAYVDSKNKA